MKYKCLEKLGFNSKEKKEHRIIRFVNKVLMAILLGIVSLIVMQYSPKFKAFMHEEVLNKNLSFGFISNIYNKYFGKILPIDNSVVEVFNEQLVYQEKEKYQDGYKLTVTKNYLVPIIEGGVIVFIGEKDNLGKVITIEGEDGSTITYGYLKNTDLKLYDYVHKGSFLGEVLDNALYISIIKDEKMCDIETYLS